MGTQVRGGSFSPLHDENPKQQNKADPGSAGAAAPRLSVNGVPSDMKEFGDVVGEHPSAAAQHVFPKGLSFPWGVAAKQEDICKPPILSADLRPHRCPMVPETGPSKVPSGHSQVFTGEGQLLTNDSFSILGDPL